MDESALAAALDAARSGDEWGITCLFRALQPRLVHYLRRHAPDAAEDLAAETWLAVAQAFTGFDGDLGDFRALLFTVARRRVADFYRARARRPQPVALVDEAAPVRWAAADTAEVALDALSTDQAIELLVRELPADQADVVLLRVVGGLSAEETGRVMGRSPGAVRVLQHRALRRLARLWAHRVVTP